MMAYIKHLKNDCKRRNCAKIPYHREMERCDGRWSDVMEDYRIGGSAMVGFGVAGNAICDAQLLHRGRRESRSEAQ